MKVIADIGNSRIKIAISQNKKISRVKTFSLKEIITIKKYLINICNKQTCSLFYSCVLGDDFEKEFRSIMEKIFIKITRFKSTKSFLSVKNAYKSPSKLGSDRWAQIICAHKLYRDNIMIVSCGSAISIDFVTIKGIHKGGMLLSGVERYIKCFSDIHNLKGIKLSRTRRVKMFSLENSTQKQIGMGYEIMVSSSINKIYSELNSSVREDVLLILSGSYAKSISNIEVKKKIIEPHFVLKSLALIENYV